MGKVVPFWELISEILIDARLKSLFLLGIIFLSYKKPDHYTYELQSRPMNIEHQSMYKHPAYSNSEYNLTTTSLYETPTFVPPHHYTSTKSLSLA